MTIPNEVLEEIQVRTMFTCVQCKATLGDEDKQ